MIGGIGQIYRANERSGTILPREGPASRAAKRSKRLLTNHSSSQGSFYEPHERVVPSPEEAAGIYRGKQRNALRGAAFEAIGISVFEGKRLKLIHQGEHSPYGQEHLTDFLGVGCIRRHFQILIQILRRQSLQTHAVAQESALLQVLRRSGIDHQN